MVTEKFMAKKHFYIVVGFQTLTIFLGNMVKIVKIMLNISLQRLYALSKKQKKN